jgi:hypothetical protein
MKLGARGQEQVHVRSSVTAEIFVSHFEATARIAGNRGQSWHGSIDLSTYFDSLRVLVVATTLVPHVRAEVVLHT